MAVRPINTSLRDSLLLNEPFSYAHLVKFEKPIINSDGKSARRAKDYVYITDGSLDIAFDDGTSDLEGNANGLQVYVANKLVSVGGIQEATLAKANTVNLQISAAALSTSIEDTSVTFTSSTFTVGEDLVEAGFREGDIVLFTYTGATFHGNINVRARIDSFSTANNIENSRANCTPLNVNNGNLVSSFATGTDNYTISFDNPEVESLFDATSTTGYARYINRDVFIYKAHIDTESGLIIGEPYLIFKGIIANGKITEDPTGGKSIVSWGVTSHWGDFVRVQGRVTSDPVHRALDGNGRPDPDAAIRKEYVNDLGFAHAEQSLNVMAIYQVNETRYKMVKRGGLAGLLGGKKLKEYQVEVDREVDLRFDLSAKHLPVVYGINKIDSIPVFVDTLNNDAKKVYVAYALCEGEIGGLYDIYFDDTSSICVDANDFDTRSQQTAENTIDVLCTGRMDRGDTLQGNNTGTGSSYLGRGHPHGRGYRDWISSRHGIEVYYVDYYLDQVASNFGSGTQSDASGLTHEKGTSYTTPIDTRLMFHSGKANQRANSLLVSQSGNFKVQTDYFSGDPSEYWGANHRLLDTAYVVCEYTIGEGETTIPSLDFVVRGKGLASYDYDYSYERHPAYQSGDAADSVFNIAQTVSVFRTSDDQALGSTTIRSFFSYTRMDGSKSNRVQFTSQPPLTYNGSPVTSFYIKDGSNNTIHFHTYDNVEDSGSVPKKLEETITAAVDDGSNTGANLTTGNDADFLAGIDLSEVAQIIGVNSEQDARDYILQQYAISSGLTSVGNTGTNASDLENNKILLSDVVKLASGANSNDDFYNGYTIELTKIVDNVPVIQTRKIIDYDGGNRIVKIEGSWDAGYTPDNTYTYRILSGGEGNKGDTRVSTNPAIQLLDYLTSKRYGRGLDINEDINLESFLEAARVCDTQSEVTVLSITEPGDAGVEDAIGDVYKYQDSNGKVWFQGTIESATEVLDSDASPSQTYYSIRFTNVSGKLGRKWADWKTLQDKELYWHKNTSTGAYYLNEKSGAGTVSEPTSSNKTSVSLTKVSGVGPASLSLEVQNFATFDGNLLVKECTSVGGRVQSASGYGLYDCDDVKYWRYLGWESQDQKYVTRHQTNAVIDTANSIFENINSILGHFNGILRYSNGKYSLDVKGQSTPLTSVTVNSETFEIEKITQDDIIGSINVEDAGQRGTYNQVSVTINDPQNRFEGRSVTMFDSTYLKQDRNITRKGDIRTPYITNYYNARLNAKQYLEQSRRSLKINFTMSPRGLLLLAGDIIEVEYPRFGWTSGKKFRIENLNFNENCLVQVTAQEHTDNAYIVVNTNTPTIVKESEASTANPPSSDPPSNLTATSNSKGGIELNWTNSSTFRSATHTVQIYRNSTDDSSTAKLIGTSKGDTYTDQILSLTQATRYYWIKYSILQPSQRTSTVAQRETFSAFHPSVGSPAGGVVGIAGVVEGGLSLRLTNENVSIPFSSTGNYDFSGTGTTLTAYVGTTQLAYDDSSPYANSSFRVTMLGNSSLASDSTPTIGADYYELGPITSITGTSGYITFSVTVVDSLGNEASADIIQNISVAPAGERGPGRWNVPVASLPVTSAQAETAWNAAWTNRPGDPVLDDQAWFYTGSETSPTGQVVWLYTGGSPDEWVNQTEVIDGQLLLDGSVGNDQLGANAVTADILATNSVTTNSLAANSVTTNTLAANSVTTNTLAANSVITNSIVSNSIVTETLAANSITANNISANSITADAIAANSITTETLAANAVTANSIAANSISANAIVANSITAETLAANAVEANTIASNAITTKHLSSASVTANSIAVNAISANAIAANSITSDTIKANAITTEKLAANAVTANTIAANTVTSVHIISQGITAAMMAANAVYANIIQAGSIEADAIAANAISANAIATNSLVAKHITSNSITSESIQANSVTTNSIAANSVTTDQIAANVVTAEHIASFSIEADNIAANSITSDKIEANSITTETLAANSITANNISANSITSDKIEANAITTDQLAANSITANNLAANSVQANVIASNIIDTKHIISGSITTETLAANAITTEKLAANAVTANSIAANSISANSIQANSISAETLAANAVTANSIASNSITTNSILAGSIDAATIGAFAVTAGKIDAGAVTAETIEANAITANSIATGSVTAETLAANAVTANAIAANSITANAIAANSVKADSIEANAVTAEKVSVVNLGAISANIGDITAGTLKGGNIPDANTGPGATEAGAFLDLTQGKMVFGNEDKYILWDGSDLTLSGVLIDATSIVNAAAGTNIQDNGVSEGEVNAINFATNLGVTVSGSPPVATINGKTDLEIRNLFSGGTGITLSSGDISLDFSELTDMTGDISGTTEFILQDGTTESRKAASEIKLSAFNNDSGFISSAVTSITAGDGLSGGTITSTGTVAVDSTVVRTSGTQTIGGAKTFSAGITTDTITGSAQASIIDFDDDTSGNGTNATSIKSLAGLNLYFDANDNDTAELQIFHGTTEVAAFDASGNLTLSGTVDGRDVATDGTKLDTIETSANNYSHPNHTGDVTSTGDGATVISPTAISGKTDLGGAPASDDTLLVHDTSVTALREMSISNLQTYMQNNLTFPTGDITSVTAGTGLTGGGTSGDVTLNVSGLTLTEFSANSIITSLESFIDDNSYLLTAAAIDDRILSYSYTTNTGTVTSVGLTAGNLIDITGGPITTSGSITVDVDLSELNDLTNPLIGTDELVALDGGVQGRKALSEIGLNLFDNSTSGFTSNLGTVTSVGGTGSVNGITLSGSVTTSGNLSLGGTLSGITLSQLAANSITTSAESFVDDDNTLMTSAAINDRIESFGYTTNTGTVTSVNSTGTVNGITLSGSVTTSGEITLGGTLSDIQVSNFAANAILTSGETFADNDTSLLTAAAIDDRILSYSYTSNAGTVTSVGLTAGNLIDITGGPITTSGSITVNVDLTELTDITATLVNTDELVVLDGTAQGRKALNEIGLSLFNNDSSFTSNTGTVTSVGSGTGLTGGPITGSGTLSVDFTEVVRTSTDQTVNGNKTFGNNIIVTGNLTVNGATTSVNSNEVNIGDNIIILNADETGVPSQNSGIEIERGTSANKTLLWDESNDKWTVGSETFVAGTFEGSIAASNITGSVTAGDFGSLTTDDLSEGTTNLYFTNARAQAAITAGNGLAKSGGTLSVNTSNGVTIVSDSVEVDSTVIRTTGNQSMSGVKTFTGQVAINNADALSFENGNHWITYNDGEGNFNIRVGHVSNASPNEISTETGYAFHDEWSQSSGWREFNVSASSITAGNDVGTWRTQLKYDANSVYAAYQGTTKLSTASDGISVTGNIAVTGTVDGRDVATDGTKLDGIEPGATADQTQADINALAITQVGTITSGTWNGSVIASAYLDADTAHLSGAQTFTGAKTFDGGIVLEDTTTQTPSITFNTSTGTDGGIDMAIRATGEGLDFYEPEDTDKIHMRIVDDAGVNAVFGLRTGSGDGTLRVDGSGNLSNIVAITASGAITLSGLSAQASEATALMINASNVVGTRELGTGAFAAAYSLPEATSTVRGGIELFSDTDQSVAANTVSATAGRTYGLQLNSAGQAVVNVPWTDSYVGTNITVTENATTVTIASSTGSNDVIDGASATLAGVVTNSTQTFGGNKTFNGSVTLNNTSLTGLNNLTFGDPGPGEGISWAGGNFSIYESPDDLATNTAGNLQFVSGGVRRATIDTSGNLYVQGQLNATTKSFLIDHPTKEGKKLRYGSLEGPENGVYVRGKLSTEENTIELPEYWTALVDEDTITVTLTPIGRGEAWVETIEDNKIVVGKTTECFYMVLAERKDVEKLIVEE